MAAKKAYSIVFGWVMVGLLLSATPVVSDDTCIFAVTADDVPPSIVLLLDNGAEMEQILWPAAYDPDTDHTPASSVFDNAYGYALKKSGNKYFP